MDPSLVRPLLRAVRRLRGGALDLASVPEPVRAALGGDVAGACGALARWADAEVRDPRAADAFLRTYGLARMPEPRTAIGRSLRSATGRRGIAPSTVDDLVRATEMQLALQIERVALAAAPPGRPTPDVWVDPFPCAATSPEVRRQLQQVLYAGWADVPDEPVHECHAALLLYEHEHGLRPPSGPVRHREQRRRLRRLAWSMLTIARERAGASPDGVLVDVLLGPRRLAVVEHLAPEAAALLANLGPRQPERFDQAVEYVRGAVRHGRPEAPELLGLLREAVARGGEPGVHDTVVAGVASLSTILAREHRHPSGVLAAPVVMLLASQASHRLTRLPPHQNERRRQQARILYDGLRAAQELAELLDVLGDSEGARRALREMAGLLCGLDPDDLSEARSWLQQHLQTSAAVARHCARISPRPELWLRRAEADAQHSLDLAEGERMPPAYRLVPSSQLLAATITKLRLHVAPGTTTWIRLERRARIQLARAEAASGDVHGPEDRPTHSGRLSVARRWWELALLCGDRDEVIAARAAALDMVRPITLPHDILKLERLEAMSRAQGIDPAEVASAAAAAGN